MAILEQRVPQNVDGRFYVDEQCIYCDLCVEIAPGIFKEFKERGWAFVYHQPIGPEEEEALAREAVEGCPTESIGTDGEFYREPKSWWQFWKKESNQAPEPMPLTRHGSP